MVIRKFRYLCITAVFIALIGINCAQAQELLTEKQIPLALAQEAAQAAVDQCRADGFLVTAAVVDPAGNLKALLREDGAGPLSVDSARKKAFTSALFRSSTSALVTRSASDPASVNLKDISDGLLFLAGGLPIASGGQVIAGIGVGGAPRGSLDEVCAQAGVDKVAADLP
jgi:uncharacterized protein GlcG (DUF336 family)